MSRGLALQPRDEKLIHAAWSLGYAPAATLRALVSPDVAPGTLRDRLRRLCQNGFLTQQRFVSPAGGLWLYGIGRAALQVGQPNPWRPSLAQISHTLAVGDAVVALTRPGFAAPLEVTGWRGEAELREWATPGAPFPDAEIQWRLSGSDGRWHVEVDRATESRAAWRRKLVRYLTADSGGAVLALTTSEPRARSLAHVAADLGVHALVTTLDEARANADPWVLDSRRRRRRPISVGSKTERSARSGE